MIHHSFPGMGTTIETWSLNSAQVEAVRALFRIVERTASRFLADSELSRANRAAGSRVHLSSLLTEILGAAAEIRSLTDGLVDAGLGGLVRAWGYDRSFEEVGTVGHAPVSLHPPEWRLDGRTLVRSPGTHLDLGGIAKGWTCDRAVGAGIGRVVSAGGDLRSSHPGTMVSVLDPEGRLAARVRVGVGALATSSTARRRWSVAGRAVSHLVDPRTLEPVESPVVSATVVSPTATRAEAGAKAVLLLGAEGLAWADEQEWISGAMVVWQDGSVFATSSLEVAA